MHTINFQKYTDGLAPVIIQHAHTHQVLMLGFMNAEAYQITHDTCKVTFYSRSKQRLWTKGETSGNYLTVNNIKIDCDNDTLLILATPAGPVCHTGSTSCFGKAPFSLPYLETVIKHKIQVPNHASYTSNLYQKGINKIAQKVGEEAVELIIEAKDNNDDLFLNEAADLLYHYLILLQAKGKTMNHVLAILEQRHQH